MKHVTCLQFTLLRMQSNACSLQTFLCEIIYFVQSVGLLIPVIMYYSVICVIQYDMSLLLFSPQLSLSPPLSTLPELFLSSFLPFISLFSIFFPHLYSSMSSMDHTSYHACYISFCYRTCCRDVTLIFPYTCK